MKNNNSKRKEYSEKSTIENEWFDEVCGGLEKGASSFVVSQPGTGKEAFLRKYSSLFSDKDEKLK